MKILSNQLRIGNYIEFNEESSIVIVKEISEYGIAVNNTNPDGEDFYTEYDQFIAIEITEEWLIKLGFKGYEDEEDNSIFELNGFNIIRNLFKKEFFLYDYMSDVEVKYVHELQNLYFALTKQELTYDSN